MSYVFEVNDDTIWSPSMIAGGFFISQVRQLERILSLPSGLTESMSDTIQVDVECLSAFLRKLSASGLIDNTSVNALARGTVVHLIALLQCAAGCGKEVGALFPGEWITEALYLASRNMLSRPTSEGSP